MRDTFFGTTFPRLALVRGHSAKERHQRRAERYFFREWDRRPRLELTPRLIYHIRRVCQELHLAPGWHTLNFSADGRFGSSIAVKGQVPVCRDLRRLGWQKLRVGVFVESDSRPPTLTMGQVVLLEEDSDKVAPSSR